MALHITAYRLQIFTNNSVNAYLVHLSVDKNEVANFTKPLEHLFAAKHDYLTLI